MIARAAHTPDLGYLLQIVAIWLDDHAAYPEPERPKKSAEFPVKGKISSTKMQSRRSVAWTTEVADSIENFG